MPRLIALVGLPGSGKSTVNDVCKQRGFGCIHFGDITSEKLQESNLPVNEDNERAMRESLRKEHGMAAYATLNIPKIEDLLSNGDTIIDGLYSWEEYLVLKEKFPEMVVWAVYASPANRYARLEHRPVRPLTADEAKSRDYSQIENLHQAGPIAMADWTFINMGERDDLINEVVKKING